MTFVLSTALPASASVDKRAAPAPLSAQGVSADSVHVVVQQLSGTFLSSRTKPPYQLDNTPSSSLPLSPWQLPFYFPFLRDTS